VMAYIVGVGKYVSKYKATTYIVVSKYNVKTVTTVATVMRY
jgi:hypothetical protein